MKTVNSLSGGILHGLTERHQNQTSVIMDLEGRKNNTYCLSNSK